jgi:hypothetical protein
LLTPSEAHAQGVPIVASQNFYFEPSHLLYGVPSGPGSARSASLCSRDSCRRR